MTITYKLELEKNTNCLTNLEYAVRKGNLLKTLETWGPQFTLRFDVKIPSRFPLGWFNLLHLTATDNSCCGPGDRLPSVMLHRDSKGLEIEIAKTGHYEQKWTTQALEFGKWHRIEVEVKQIANSTMDKFTFSVDGIIVWHFWETSITYQNVYLYLSSPWEPSLGQTEAKVKNLELNGEHIKIEPGSKGR